MAKRSQARRKNYDEQYSDKKQKKGSRNGRKHQTSHHSNIVELNAHYNTTDTAYSTQRSNQPLKARTPAQQTYINAIKNNALTFGIGPAGTGKSYCAGALAAQALESGEVERIIITRPAVEAGENLGFLPGGLDEKFAVYIDAFRDILNERLGSGTVDYCLRHGRIVAAPLAFMRGKTFDEKTFVILDEAQNTTLSQMKMFLTRIGERCKVVINGDIKQSDIRGQSGLADAVNRLQGVNNVFVHEFERADIVRSGLVREIIELYEPEDAEEDVQ